MHQDLIKIATETQRQATIPHQSFWVSASAGTGKTKVLVDRVIRLLLEGVQPSQILCLTYTKTASSEMIERVLKTLKNFVRLSNEELTEKLKPFLPNPTEENLNHARSLFANVLDKIHTLKIQTIHAFCQSVLQKFPIEADLDPSFSMMDDTQKRFCVEESYDKMLNDAFKINGSQELKKALEHSAENMSEFIFNEQKDRILSHFQKFSELFSKDSIDKIIERTQHKLNLKKEDFEKKDDEFFKGCPLEAFSNSKENSVLNLFIKMKNICQNSKPDFQNYKILFLTQKGTIKKNFKNPTILEEAERTLNWDNFLKTRKVFLDTKAIVILAHSFLENYQEMKKKSGSLDFDDLIMKTANLLSSKKNLPWILYKMDGEISHILVDEAQDTSPIQWKIIDALTEDFFTDGRNKNDVKTLFVVGDKKQSIYSFQGSDVKSFHSSYNAFRKKLLEKNYPLTKLPLNISFRTSQDILDLVDAIFQLHEEGVIGINEKLKHTSAQIHVGRIEIFPVLEKEKTDAKSGENIKQSVEKKIKMSAESRLAKKVVDNIKNLLDSKIKLPSTGKNIEPKDILILLQKRNPLAYPLAKFLKNADIPFEGLDKFTLKDDLAILDLLACLKFAIFPYDDLNTASLLKSPFFNLQEKDIFEVCFNRDEKHVFEKVLEDFKYEKIKNILKLLREKSTLSPFDFFSFILENLDGRHVLLQTLGEKHAQPIEEFLTLAFDYSKNPEANLSEFLTYINSSNPAVKREFKKDSLKGIRLMSVHGAKGLEAPVVILPDTTRMQNSIKNPIFFDTEGDFFSTSYSENRNAFLSNLVEMEKEKNLHESRRLLYVALTRPKDLLQVFGYGTIYKKSWYEIIKAGSLQLDFRIEKKHDEDIFIYGGNFEKSNEKTIIKKTEKEEKRVSSFLPKEREITIPESQNKSAEIGTKIHEILDRLTSITAGKRQDFIKKSLVNLSQKDQFFWYEKLNKICTEKYDFLFKKNNLSEKEIITSTGQLLRIDNICFVDNEIWIVDYKTDDEKEKIPNEYKKQLQKYIYSVNIIYSNKKIRAFVLWIKTGKLHEL